MIWNKSKECMSRDEMSALQSERLVKQVKNVYDHVEFYRKKMERRGINIRLVQKSRKKWLICGAFIMKKA